MVMIDVGAGRHPQGAIGVPVWREDRDVIDVVRGGPNYIRTTYADALETHRLALAVAHAMETGQSVAISAVPATTPVRPLRRPTVARYAQ